MQIVMRKTEELVPYERNPRKNESAVDAVAESIRQFGFKVPIVLDKDNVIIAGHTRLKAAEKLGLEEVPTITADDLTPEQVKAFRLADNKTAELAGWDFDLLDEELDDITGLDMTAFGFDDGAVERERFIKINPAEFIERNPLQNVRGYQYRKICDFITDKKQDGVFLISPLDAIEETAEQVAYKRATKIERTIRASKCTVVPVPVPIAQDFFIRNHRQTAPLATTQAVTLGLDYRGELVAVMMYDKSNGAVRGAKSDYELMRLSISKNTQVHGGASKLQKACEEALREKGETRIFSYSNATINNGKVYEALDFQAGKITGGQPHVILRNNALVRLINLYPKTTNGELAIRGWIKTFLGGNKMWTKEI